MEIRDHTDHTENTGVFSERQVLKKKKNPYKINQTKKKRHKKHPSTQRKIQRRKKCCCIDWAGRKKRRKRWPRLHM